MAATNFDKPRTEAYTRIVEKIAQHTGTGYECTLRAVETITAYYNGYSCEQLAITLLSFLQESPVRRHMVLQFTESLQEQQVEGVRND